MLNSPNGWKCEERTIFKKHFPAVAKVIEEINRGYTKVKKGKGEQRWQPGDQVCTFAHITQMLEARVLLDLICLAIKSHSMKIPIYTIHDSILTTPEHVATVK